ncbi:phospholipase-like protein [Tanacetum coccineum]
MSTLQGPVVCPSVRGKKVGVHAVDGPLMKAKLQSTNPHVNVGVEQVVHGIHGQGCSDGTFLRPDTNLDHMQVVNIENQRCFLKISQLIFLFKLVKQSSLCTRYVDSVLGYEKEKMKCCEIKYKSPKQASSQSLVYVAILIAGLPTSECLGIAYLRDGWSRYCCIKRSSSLPCRRVVQVPRVLVTCKRRQIDDENDDDENVPLYYHINKDFSIPFGREEFCLVTGLRFGVQNWAEYDTKERIPFRRRVFPSYLDGQPITGIDIANMIIDQSFAQLYDNDAVSLCCLGILQLVILGVESRRDVPDWMLRLANDRVAWTKYPWDSYVWPTLYSQLRNANVKRWSPLYVAQPTHEDDVKTYSIFGYTWAFKEMNVQPVRQENKEPIIIEQHYGLSDFSQFQSMQGGPSSFQGHVNSTYFNMGTPPNFQTPMPSQPGSSDWKRQMPAQSATKYWQPDISSQPGSYYSFGQVPSHMGRPNLQTTIETHHDVDGIFDQQVKLTPFMEQPPTTILPKQRVNKTKNKDKKAILSPLNLGGAFEDDNVEENNVTFLGSQFTGNFLMYENVDPTKLIRLPYGTPIGWLSGEHMNSSMELLIRMRNAKANWTVAYTGTISVYLKNNQFIIPTDQHVIGTLDGTTRPYPAWNDVDWVFMPIHVVGNH